MASKSMNPNRRGESLANRPEAALSPLAVENNVQNRRESRRWNYHRQLTVCVQHPGGGVARLNVEARDLSSRGFSFIHSGFIYPGSACAVSLLTRDGRADAFAGTVVRCRHAEGAAHEIGVKFNRKINVQPYVDLRQDESGDEGRSAVEPANLRGRVLYIEDNPMDRRLLTHLLGNTAIECRCVTTISEGLGAFAETLFDVVMTDLNLADEDGVDLIKRIRATGFAGPIVILSAEGAGQRLIDARQAGATHTLMKPYEPKQLFDLMVELHIAVGAVMDADAIHSTLDDQPAMHAPIAEFVSYAKEAAGKLEKLMLANDLKGSRAVCLDLKGSAPAFGFAPLGEIAREAAKSLDATMSVAESRPHLRSLVLMSMNLNLPRTRANAQSA